MLGRGHLVVLGLGQDAQLPQLVVQLLHEGLHPGLDDAEIMVIQLLALGGLRAQQRAAGEHQVLPGVDHLLVHQEVLLLRADGGDGCHVFVAEQLQYPADLAVDGLHAAQKGCLHVQRLAAEAAKSGGNVQHGILYEGEGGWVPGGIAPSFEGGAQAAGGERRGVGFAPHQFLAGELHDRAPVAIGGDEAVVLFGGNARHRLEPVSKVGRALLDGPVLHGVGDDVRHGDVQALAIGDAAQHLPVGVLGQPLAHGRKIEHLRGKAV